MSDRGAFQGYYTLQTTLKTEEQSVSSGSAWLKDVSLRHTPPQPPPLSLRSWLGAGVCSLLFRDRLSLVYALPPLRQLALLRCNLPYGNLTTRRIWHQKSPLQNLLSLLPRWPCPMR